MITVGMSTPIRAPRARVWAALSDASEIVHWRPGPVEPLDALADYPAPGQRMRWRCRVRGLPVILHETPLEVNPREQLHCQLALGAFRFEQTFTLTGGTDTADETRLGIKIAARNEIPLLGGTLDRFAVRRFATDMAAIYLQAVRDWCENSRANAPPLPALPAPPSLAVAGR